MVGHHFGFCIRLHRSECVIIPGRGIRVKREVHHQVIVSDLDTKREIRRLTQDVVVSGPIDVRPSRARKLARGSNSSVKCGRSGHLRCHHLS